MQLNIYVLFFFKLLKTEGISDKWQNILQSFLLKSKLLCLPMCKVFYKGHKTDLILFYLREMAVGSHIPNSVSF